MKVKGQPVSVSSGDKVRFRQAVSALLLFLAFFLILLALYHRGLHAEMYYDSREHILEKARVFASGDLLAVIGIFPQRPMTMATFYANYLWGGLDARLFRLANLALLAATGAMVAILISTILEISQPQSGRIRLAVSVGISLFFVIHPILTWATLYIWQRAALLACFFSVSSLTVYLLVRSEQLPHKAGAYIICLLLFEAALFSKENSVAIPVVLLAAEIAFFSTPWKELFARGAVLGLVTILSVLVLSFLEHPHGDVKLSTGIVGTIANYYQGSGLTFMQVILTQCRMFFFYLSLIVEPLPARGQLVIPQTISSSLLNPPSTLVAVIGLIALVPTTAYLLRKRPVWAFGILFYSASLLPEAVLVPEYAFFGYRAIMPMVAVLIVVADLSLLALKSLASREPKGRALRGLLAVFGGVYLALVGVDTFYQAEIWRDRTSFWQDVVARFPASEAGVERTTRVHALYNLGCSLLEKKRLPEALESFLEACRIAPDHAESQNAAGAVLQRLGRLSEAERHFRSAASLNPQDHRARKNLKTLLREMRKLKERNAEPR